MPGSLPSKSDCLRRRLSLFSPSSSEAKPNLTTCLHKLLFTSDVSITIEGGPQRSHPLSVPAVDEALGPTMSKQHETLRWPRASQILITQQPASIWSNICAQGPLPHPAAKRNLRLPGRRVAAPDLRPRVSRAAHSCFRSGRVAPRSEGATWGGWVTQPCRKPKEVPDGRKRLGKHRPNRQETIS